MFKECCAPFLLGVKQPASATELMRSRYVAFATQQIDYLIATTHFSTRQFHHKDEVLEWAVSNKWLRLEVLEATMNTVTFKAFYENIASGQKQVHHELSTFKNENGIWFYVDGQFLS
ncbi:preprotein translocase SecA [Flavobacterium sp. UMI-01]|nr:preprotein translocase SecA [Flavobacterium sp. UMI-01]